MTMTKDELQDQLRTLAGSDLSDGADIHDHPCVVASRAIDQCFEDVNFLKDMVRRPELARSKKGRMITGLSYSPSW